MVEAQTESALARHQAGAFDAVCTKALVRSLVGRKMVSIKEGRSLSATFLTRSWHPGRMDRLVIHHRHEMWRRVFKSITLMRDALCWCVRLYVRLYVTHSACLCMHVRVRAGH